MITPAEISTDFTAYAARRGDVVRVLGGLRRVRRVRVGDLITFEFESEDTVRHQVQEMVFVERLSEAPSIQGEIDAYSRLLPDHHSLVATMFIELDDPAAIQQVLLDLKGVQHAISLEISGLPPCVGVEIPGPDEDPDLPTETVSVHMLRFPMSDAQRDAFRDPSVSVELVVDHEAYSDGTPLTGDTRLALIKDLQL